MPEPFIMGTRAAYAAPNITLQVNVAKMNMLANTFMRAPGESVGTFALESAIDELAVELGMDPIALRLQNEPDRGPGPPACPSPRATSSRRGAAGAERFGWAARNAVPASRRDGEWQIGLGCATGTYPYYRMPGAAARITLTPETVTGSAPRWRSPRPRWAWAPRPPLRSSRRNGSACRSTSIDVGYGDSSIPGAIMAGGSQQTAAIGAAVIAAHNALVADLLKLAGNDSPLAGLSPDDDRQRGRRPGESSTTPRCVKVTPRSSPARNATTLEVDCRSLAPARTDALVDAFAQRDLLRSTGQRRHGRDPRQPYPRIVRLRPHPEPQDGA